jgi:ribosomal protein S18 acetylase RimI-like enzyme
MPITLRPETDDDLDLLRRVYAASRDREMALLISWSAAQKDEFLAQQFHAQRHHYRSHYPGASFDVIEQDTRPIGRLYVARPEQEIRLMDIALLPECRNQGIGGSLCEALLDEARDERRVVSLHVEDDNPAKRLYERLGFRDVAEVTFYRLMHWVPPGLEAVSEKLVGAAQVTTTS